MDGKALRGKLPRRSHARWKRSTSQPSPIETLRASDAKRMPELVPVRYGRMLQSPFAFYRGSAAIMAADLANTPSTGILVQACGDCHLMNFGAFATPERNIVFDINDFDETYPAPWEWDVKRLAASFVLAARSNGYSGVASKIAQTSVRAYRKWMRKYAHMHPLDAYYAKIGVAEFLALAPPRDRARIRKRVERVSAKRGHDVAYPKLTHVRDGTPRLRDNPPLIFHPEQSKEKGFDATVSATIAQYRETLSDERRILLDRYRFVDAAIKVVGIGSVGTQCWVALLMSASDEPLLLQFKEANDSVLAAYAGEGAYSHNGQRVVAGQRMMQTASDIFLGWMTGPDGRHFYGRQLRDAKMSAPVDAFDEAALQTYARACGWCLARAHARSGDAEAIATYLGSGPQFDEAASAFAEAYADQAERDHAALKAAVRAGHVEIAVQQ